MQPEFETFPKIARLSRDVTVTEKIDGSNSQVFIHRIINASDQPPIAFMHATATVAWDGSDYAVFAGSRNRWVTPGKSTDNHGFAGWVADHAIDLVIGLGEGRHYGEWWGAGIQRGYNQREKRFSLFNTFRWNAASKPACCAVVPVLYEGPFTSAAVDAAVIRLRMTGSAAAPHFMSPEGVIVYHGAARCYFKKTLERDDEPKALEAVMAADGSYEVAA